MPFSLCHFICSTLTFHFTALYYTILYCTYVQSTVKALRAQAQRFLSAVNTPMGQGQGQHGLFSHSVSMSFKDSRDSSSNNLMRDMRESRDMRDNFNSGISSMRSVSSNNFSTASPSHSSASTPRKRVPDILPLPFMSSASTSSFSPSPSASSSSYTSPSSFPSQLSLGTSSLTASSGNHVGYEGERRNAYFKRCDRCYVIRGHLHFHFLSSDVI